MIYKCYDLETWHDCSWRLMMTSWQKWRHHLFWSLNYTPKREILKNADQAFLAAVFSLIFQKSSFWLIFNIISKLKPKKIRVPTIFISHCFGQQNAELLLLLLSIFELQKPFACERQLGLTWNFQGISRASKSTLKNMD